MKDIYVKKGYKSRGDYMRSLSKEYDVSFNLVTALADMLGPNEDFDGLVNSLEDLEYELY